MRGIWDVIGSEKAMARRIEKGWRKPYDRVLNRCTRSGEAKAWTNCPNRLAGFRFRDGMDAHEGFLERFLRGVCQGAGESGIWPESATVSETFGRLCNEAGLPRAMGCPGPGNRFGPSATWNEKD